MRLGDGLYGGVLGYFDMGEILAVLAIIPVSLHIATCIAPESILLFFAKIHLARNHVPCITDFGDLGPSDWPPEYAQKRLS